VDEFWLVAGGRVDPYPDDLEQYAERIRQRVAPVASEAGPSRRERRQASAEHRRQTQSLRTTVKRLEARIETMSNDLKALEETLADPATYETMSTQKLQTVIAQRTDLMRDLKTAETEWLRQHEHLDALIAATALDSDERSAG
jgi:ATP-binding cassette subfamily F protein 3